MPITLYAYYAQKSVKKMLMYFKMNFFIFEIKRVIFYCVRRKENDKELKSESEREREREKERDTHKYFK